MNGLTATDGDEPHRTGDARRYRETTPLARHARNRDRSWLVVRRCVAVAARDGMAALPSGDRRSIIRDNIYPEVGGVDQRRSFRRLQVHMHEHPEVFLQREHHSRLHSGRN